MAWPGASRHGAVSPVARTANEVHLCAGVGSLVPGIIGLEHYLGFMSASRRANFLESVFLEMLGSSTELAFQLSRAGDSAFDGLIPTALSASNAKHRVVAYAEVILNDEYIWEAYNVPMSSQVSLPRVPQPPRRVHHTGAVPRGSSGRTGAGK